MWSSPANLLTLLRIAVIAPIVVLLFFDGEPWRWTAFGLYVAACVTDFFDGYLARAMNQVSALGRFLDPIADKLLVAAILLMLTASGDLFGIDVVAGLIILMREIAVSGLREFLAELRVGMPVSRLAKWKTAIQMVAIGALVLGPVDLFGLPTHEVGMGLLWFAALLTLVTGLDYLRAGLKHLLADSRA